MWKFDPNLQFCSKNGLIGFARKDKKYKFYIAPSEDASSLFPRKITRVEFAALATAKFKV